MKLSDYENCHNIPIKLPPGYEQLPVLLVAPPDTLHCVDLGPPNQLLKILHKKWPRQLEDIYHEVGMPERSSLYGGNFNGNHIRQMWQEQHLDKFLVLPNGEEIVRYLRSLRMVHEISVSRALPSSYPVVMAEFREAFEVIFRLRYANWTPKVHIVYSHFEVTYKKYLEKHITVISNDKSSILLLA